MGREGEGPSTCTPSSPFTTLHPPLNNTRGGPYLPPSQADLISTIAGLVTDKERCRELGLEGVADVRDESDRRGLKVVVELRKGAAAEDTLARLLKHTRLQVGWAVG